MIIAYVDRSNLSVALAVPEFRRVFQFTDSQRGALNSAFFWSYAVLQIPAGWLVDRCGVKWSYAVAFLLWSLTSAATALCGTLAAFLGARVLLGIGESLVTPASMRWIRFHFPERQRGLAVGILMSGTKFGPAVGALASAWLIEVYGWKTMFAILGLGALVWVAPWLLLVEDDDRRIERAAATAPAVPFARMMRSPVLWGTIIGTFCYMYFVYFCMTWMPAYLVERRHLSLASMGWYTFFSFAGMAVMAVAAGAAADRLIAGGRDPVAVRKAFTIAGFLMAATELVGAYTNSVPVALFFAIFSLTGLGLATANYWALTQTLIPGGAIGRMVGIQNCAANLPGIAAPLLTGWLKTRTGGYAGPIEASGAFLALGVAAYTLLVRRRYAPR